MESLLIKFITPSSQSLLMTNESCMKLEFPEGSIFFDIELLDVGTYNAYTLKSQPLNIQISEELLRRIYNSLYLSSLEFPISLLLEPSLISNLVTQNTLDEVKLKHNVNIKSDFIGIREMETDTIFMTVLPVAVKNSSDYKIFEQKINKFLNTKYKKDDRIIRAIELLNSSYYFSSINRSSKFIMLMCAVEVLLKPEKVSKRLQLTIESTKRKINNLKIEKDEKDSILGSMEFLKKSSINRTGTMLSKKLLGDTKTYNGFSASEFFKKAYDLRSKFVHYGINKTKYLDINSINIEEFVKDLLTAYFNKICC